MGRSKSKPRYKSTPWYRAVSQQRPRKSDALLLESLKDGIPRELVHETIANAYRHKRRYSQSDSIFSKEHERFPNPVFSWKNRSTTSQGKTMARSRDLFPFAGYFAKRFPAQNTHRHSYAQVLFNLKEYQQSEKVLQPLLNRKEPTPRALLLQANIMAKTEEWKKGKHSLKRQRLNDETALWSYKNNNSSCSKNKTRINLLFLKEKCETSCC